jgi:hypothetical protein
MWGVGMTPKVLWEVVRKAAKIAEINKPAPHDREERVLAFVIWPAANLTRFSSCSATSLFRQRSVIWAANKSYLYAVNDKPGIDP